MKTRFYLAAVLIVLIAVFFSAESKASAHIILHMASSHIDQTFYYDYETGEPVEFNQQNPGVGFGYDLTPWAQARAGLYNNSHDKLTTYAALYLNKKFNRYLSAGIQAGLMTGYRNTVHGATYNKAVAPMVLPTVALTANRVSMELGYIPKIWERGSAVATLSTSIKF